MFEYFLFGIKKIVSYLSPYMNKNNMRGLDPGDPDKIQASFLTQLLERKETAQANGDFKTVT